MSSKKKNSLLTQGMLSRNALLQAAVACTEPQPGLSVQRAAVRRALLQ